MVTFKQQGCQEIPRHCDSYTRSITDVPASFDDPWIDCYANLLLVSKAHL